MTKSERKWVEAVGGQYTSMVLIWIAGSAGNEVPMYVAAGVFAYWTYVKAKAQVQLDIEAEG